MVSLQERRPHELPHHPLEYGLGYSILRPYPVADLFFVGKKVPRDKKRHGTRGSDHADKSDRRETPFLVSHHAIGSFFPNQEAMAIARRTGLIISVTKTPRITAIESASQLRQREGRPFNTFAYPISEHLHTERGKDEEATHAPTVEAESVRFTISLPIAVFYQE